MAFALSDLVKRSRADDLISLEPVQTDVSFFQQGKQFLVNDGHLLPSLLPSIIARPYDLDNGHHAQENNLNIGHNTVDNDLDLGYTILTARENRAEYTGQEEKGNVRDDREGA